MQHIIRSEYRTVAQWSAWKRALRFFFSFLENINGKSEFACPAVCANGRTGKAGFAGFAGGAGGSSPVSAQSTTKASKNTTETPVWPKSPLKRRVGPFCVFVCKSVVGSLFYPVIFVCVCVCAPTRLICSSTSPPHIVFTVRMKKILWNYYLGYKFFFFWIIYFCPGSWITQRKSGEPIIRRSLGWVPWISVQSGIPIYWHFQGYLETH